MSDNASISTSESKDLEPQAPAQSQSYTSWDGNEGYQHSSGLIVERHDQQYTQTK